MRPHRITASATLIVLGGAFASAGCSGVAAGETPEATAQAWLDALEDEDASTFCGLLTEAGRAGWTIGNKTCEDSMQVLFDEPDNPDPGEPTTERAPQDIKGSTTKGRRATVRTSNAVVDTDRGSTKDGVLELVKVGDRWYIDSVGAEPAES